MTGVLTDPGAIQRQASEAGVSAWVGASAGTGKTKVLADRVLSLMLGGSKPGRILCLTFTRAAAAEMANRIAKILGEWSTDADAKLAEKLNELLGREANAGETLRARRLFAEVLDAPGGLHIQTIHAFCQSLLGRFPIEAGVPPHVSVMDEREAHELLESARRHVLRRASAGDADLSRAMTSLTDHLRETGFVDIVRTVTSERAQLRRFIDRFGSIDAAIEGMRVQLGLSPDQTAADVVAACCVEDAFDGAGLRRAVSALDAGSATDQKRARVLADWLAAPLDQRAEHFAAYTDAYLTKDATPKVRARMITKKALGVDPGAGDVLADEAERLLAALMRLRAAVTADVTGALLVIGNALLSAYADEKSRRALLDYDDLILLSRDLLRRPDSAPWVLYKLDGGIDHILIDEAQDTNPEQWDVVEALASEFFAGDGARGAMRTVFAVGDVKQSIYGFQRADPEAFKAMRDLFAHKVPAANCPWRLVDLFVSFRSTRAVLNAVDAVFADPLVAAGVNLDGVPIRHEAWRAQDGGLVEVWPAVTPREIDAAPAWKPPVERVAGDSPQARLARLIAARIKDWIDTGEMLEAKGRPIRPGDIMVLVRRRTGFVEDLVRALKEKDVGVAGVDRMVLTEQLAVMDLIALGRFLLLPEDDLTLATVLKGPLIGLSEEELFRLAYDRKGTLWGALNRRARTETVFADAETELKHLLGLADAVPPFELYTHILGPRRGRERLLARLGMEAEDALAVFLDLALSYERSHTPSLQGFLQWVETGDVEVKRDLEQNTGDAVRILTVHGAKGLQAPIVFLPDTLQMPLKGPQLLWPRDEDGHPFMLFPPNRATYEDVAEAERARQDTLRDQEYRRLLYVAMTRAEDRLYVCGWQTRRAAPEGCWYHLIRDGLVGVADAVDDPFLAQTGEVDEGSILRLHSPQTKDAPTKDDQAETGKDVTELPGWALCPPAPEPDPPRPLSPSRPSDDEPSVLSPLMSDAGNARFVRGSLIHRLLQTLPDMPSAARPQATRDFLGRPVHGLDGHAQAAIAEETLAVLDQPGFKALFGPDSRAEVPIVGAIGGTVVSGQVDRLLVTETEIVVVDFKTNRPPPTRADDVAKIYLKQLAAYRDLLRQIYPDKPIRCALLWTDGPTLMSVPDALLDPWALDGPRTAA